MDVSVKETSICIVDDAGKIVREEQVLALAESWLTIANIHNRFCSNPSYSEALDGNDANH
jgi:hypothetical protein